MNVGILAVEYCVGELVQTNANLEEIVSNFDVNRSQQSLDSWVKSNFGIETRVKTKKAASELAVEACRSLLKKSNLEVGDIDFLVLNTASGDYKQPTTATAVQTAIGMKRNSFAMEINMPCAGNIYGLATAYSFIKAGLGKVGLVVGVDKMSAIVDQEDFILSGIFGDAASACLIGIDGPLEIRNIYLNSKADLNHTLSMFSSGSKHPVDSQNLNLKNHFLKMKGKETKDFISFSLKDTIVNLLNASKLEVHEVDQLVVHQASKRIIEETLEEMGFSNSQYLFTLEKYGNTSSASILLTLAKYLEESKSFKNIFLVGMGAGLNWGGVYLEKMR